MDDVFPRAVALAAAACVGLAAPVSAQTESPSITPSGPLKAWGSTRLRYELIDGQVRPGFDTRDDIVSLRSIVGVEWRDGPVRLVGELYDSRVWDEGPGSAISTGEVNTLELVQAYAALDIDGPFGEGSRASVQAGRFTLNLGSRRLVAADDYRNTTNGYTGARVDLRGAAGSLTVIGVMPQVRLPDGLADIRANRRASDRATDDLVLWGGIASRQLGASGPLAEVSYFHLEEGDRPDRPTRNRSLDTVGGRLIRDPAAGRLDYEVEAFVQTGTIRTGTAPAAPVQDVSAGFVHLDVGYTFADAWKTRLSVEYDWASGDAPGGDFGRFDTLFGMRRADLAPAGLYNAIGRANISTPAVRIETNPSRDLDMFAAARGLWLAEATDAFSTTGVRDPTGRSGTYAGVQIEARARYWLVRDRARLEGNLVWLFKDGVLENAPNAPRNGDATYVSASVTVSF